jgi:hypothetical protein
MKATGRKERVMITCVTFETAKVTDPIKFYDTKRVHIIHYAEDPKKDPGKMYMEFYERVCELILENNRRDNENNNFEIIEHFRNVNDFTVMLRTVLQIIEEENNREDPSDIYVNISSGTSHYVSAALIASMMMPDTIPFSVSSNFLIDNVRDIFYKDGRPVGLTESIKEYNPLPKYTIPIPDRTLVLGLRVLNDLNKNKPLPRGPDIIKVLKDKGLWRRDSDKAESEAVYYRRDYVDKWLSNKWVEYDDFKKRYFLTKEGEMIINTFYCELE